MMEEIYFGLGIIGFLFAWGLGMTLICEILIPFILRRREKKYKYGGGEYDERY